MPLHLIKLCVGVDSVEDLEAWVAPRRKRGREHVHVTRMTPKRAADLLDGGSLYWVIRGFIQVRQRLLGLRPVTEEDGIPRCGIVLEPELIPTGWQPRRPFQGWRYLEDKDAPPDLHGSATAAMPPKLRAELAELGLL